MNYNDYNRGQQWHAKGMAKLPLIAAAMVVAVLLVPINFAVEDLAWSWALAGMGIASVVVQVAAAVRMVLCHRRARKIWRGAR